VAETDFPHYVANLEHLLDLVDAQLTAPQGERIRFAVRNRHDPVKVRDLLVDTAADNLGGRILHELSDADGELSTDEVRRLEDVVLAGLPSPS
jgi:hypothetical protein